jgi:predicted nucleic acid-binding protein
MRALIDSSVFIAAARTSETHHQRARAALEAHAASGLATPVTILAETMSFIGARLGAHEQRRFWDGFIASGIELIPVDAELVQSAREIDRHYSDLALGFADCTLLAACERERTPHVLSLDTRLLAFNPSFAPALLLLP